MKNKERLFITAALASLLTLHPAGVSAQSYTMSYRNEPITQVLRDLKKRTGYEFVYQKQLLDDIPAITCQCKSMALNQALSCILRDHAHIDYEIVGNTIVLKPRSATPQAVRQSDNRHTVKGVIVDEKGLPPVLRHGEDKRLQHGHHHRRGRPFPTVHHSAAGDLGSLLLRLQHPAAHRHGTLEPRA